MRILALALAASMVSAAAAQGIGPERVVDATTVISARQPRMHISVPKTARYLGAERWDLYGVADCEIHLFVDAGPDRQVRRVYWIQFEGFLPHLPDKKYDYSKDELRHVQDLEFRVRARFGPTSQAPKPGSDGERVRQMLAKAGYTMPAHMMNVRLVHLFEESRRELMVIYAEDLAPTGYTSADLQRGNDAAPEWRPIEKALVERATKQVRFRH